ncbi:MAG: ribose-phosphate pyrophosphokinase [Thermoanaerobaculaceae bacterium]|nr:ribose-phosphate pyrophosphokinase [Thermoanaerobaculaceae bacterium]
MHEHRALVVLSGRAHPELTDRICDYLQIRRGAARLYNFSDGENGCQIEENVRGGDVYVVQPTCRPVNDSLMELLIILDACRRSSASRVTAVIPYFGYARQDRKDRPRVPITAKLVCDLITSAGAARILSMDLHAAQIQGFFNIPVDHLFAAPVLIEELRRLQLPDLVLVSPDAGGVERARAFAKRLSAGLAIVDKRRTSPNQAEVMNIIGDVQGRTCVIVDDIIDTAGTLVKTAEVLAERGAARVLAAGVHPVLSGPSVARIEASVVEQVVVTDTIPLSDEARGSGKIRQLSVAELLGEAIRRIHEAKSVSSLFV